MWPACTDEMGLFFIPAFLLERGYLSNKIDWQWADGYCSWWWDHCHWGLYSPRHPVSEGESFLLHLSPTPLGMSAKMHVSSCSVGCSTLCMSAREREFPLVSGVFRAPFRFILFQYFMGKLQTSCFLAWIAASPMQAVTTWTVKPDRSWSAFFLFVSLHL